MSAPMLHVSRLRAGYGAAQVLDDVNFDVRRGEAVALIGRNGAGKTTTMKAVMGLIDRAGDLRFDGRDIARLAPYEIARLGIGYVPEDRRIFTDLTVRENLDVGRKPPRDAVPRWDDARVFALFPQLAAMPDRPGGQMSGGEQQMLTVARTLMGNPSLVLLDEPSEGVAPIVLDQLAAAIVEMKEAGLSILLAEQNFHFAALVCDRAIVLDQGCITWVGPMAELAENDALQRSYLAV